MMLVVFLCISGFGTWEKYGAAKGSFLLFFLIGLAICGLLYKWKSSVVKEWNVIHGMLFFFWIAAMVSKVTDKTNPAAMWSGFLFFVAGAILNGLGLYREKIGGSLKKWVMQHWQLLVLMLLFVLLSLETLPSTPRGDSNTYFRMGFLYAAPKFDFTLSNLSDFCLADHMAIGYAFLGLMGVFFDTADAIGLRIVDIVLILASAAAFYELLGMFVEKAKPAMKALATGAYLFHPMVFGMIASVSLDKPTLALMVIFTYLYLSKKRLLASFAGFLFLTTKEPNVLFYGGFMAAVYLVDFFGMRKAGILARIRHTFGRAQFVVDIMHPIIAAYLILATGSWASNNGVRLDYVTLNSFHIVEENTISKNLQLGVLNFNWLLLAGTAVFLVIVFFQYGGKRIFRSAKFRELAVPLGVMQMVFAGFQYVFYTYPNARYITPYEFVLTLGLGVLVLAANVKVWVKNAGLGALTLLLATQSVVTIDPLTVKKFAHLKAGEAWVCSTEWENVFNFNQTMEYNRQYTYWDGVLREILSDIDTEKKVLIGEPNLENTYFFAQFYPHWNAERKMFGYTVLGEDKLANYPVEDTVLLNYGTVTEEEFADIRAQNYEEVYMLVPEMYQEYEDVQNTLRKAKVLESREYKYRGWNVLVYQLEI